MVGSSEKIPIVLDTNDIEISRMAWELARKFSLATGDNIVNIYVVDHEHRPVEGYRIKVYKPYKI